MTSNVEAKEIPVSLAEQPQQQQQPSAVAGIASMGSNASAPNNVDKKQPEAVNGGGVTTVPLVIAEKVSTKEKKTTSGSDKGKATDSAEDSKPAAIDKDAASMELAKTVAECVKEATATKPKAVEKVAAGTEPTKPKAVEKVAAVTEPTGKADEKKNAAIAATVPGDASKMYANAHTKNVAAQSSGAVATATAVAKKKATDAADTTVAKKKAPEAADTAVAKKKAPEAAATAVAKKKAPEAAAKDVTTTEKAAQDDAKGPPKPQAAAQPEKKAAAAAAQPKSKAAAAKKPAETDEPTSVVGEDGNLLVPKRSFAAKSVLGGRPAKRTKRVATKTLLRLNPDPAEKSKTTQDKKRKTSVKQAAGKKPKTDGGVKKKSKTTGSVKTPPAKNVAAKSPGSAKTRAKEIWSGPPDDKIAGGWPQGWTKKTFERMSGATKGTTDSYWYSPQANKKFRSLKEVTRFMNGLKMTNGDELEAWKLLKAKKV